ncbi:unnamed protein product [Acanthoscelides obtectus]|uniref:Nose resistant-to-fluoxetine protein N-terminal domain-containing protein n=1 Tax=Acanthoscelides obtectus TaxID=200917 RepID=A0A9P0LQC0_ACAOB|nr:unnamed protein product [Acanthoscelides obtectus]CAK1665593.1 Nose resistant to fluoxetine protein 6 [Acanthoscelides obtectus]
MKSSMLANVVFVLSVAGVTHFINGDHLSNETSVSSVGESSIASRSIILPGDLSNPNIVEGKNLSTIHDSENINSYSLDQNIFTHERNGDQKLKIVSESAHVISELANTKKLSSEKIGSTKVEQSSTVEAGNDLDSGRQTISNTNKPDVSEHPKATKKQPPQQLRNTSSAQSSTSLKTNVASSSTEKRTRRTSSSRGSNFSEKLKGWQPLYGIGRLGREALDTKCRKELQQLVEAIENKKVWALKALDASGTPEPGFFYGNNLWIGSHFQCVDISNRKPFEVNKNVPHAAPTPYDYPPFQMAFAMVYARHNSTLQQHTQLPSEWTVQLGLCIPKSCSSDDLKHLSKKYFSEDNLEFQNIYKVKLDVLDVKKLRDDAGWFFMLPKTIIFSVIVIITLLCCIVGTILDVRRHNKEKNLISGHNAGITMNGKCVTTNISTVELVPPGLDSELSNREPSSLEKILVCFSVYSNTKNLMKTKLSSDSIGCIHGLRFLGMLWVIGVHSIFYQVDFFKDQAVGFRVSEEFFSQIFSNSTYCVDTYLVISGFLVGYLYYKAKNPHEEMKKKLNCIEKINEFFQMSINRYLRLTPPYIVLIIFADCIHTYYKYSSSLTSFEKQDQLCEKYWWRNLLYINNLYPRSEMCLSWSWYLSLDTQAFMVAIALLILSTVVFKIAAAFTILLVLVNIVAVSMKTYSIGYIPTMDEQFAQLDAIYDLPWHRIGPYLIGVITAYFLKVRLQNKLSLQRSTRIFLWTIFPLLNLWIIFTIYTRQISIEYSAFYMGTSRVLWGIGISWILIACCTGNAPLLNKFLSFKGFIPLSRMTYCAYLLNPLTAQMMFLGSETGFTAVKASMALSICAVSLNTFYMSYLYCLMFECPFVRLTKMALTKVMGKRSGTQSNRTDDQTQKNIGDKTNNNITTNENS